jgi:hypothetical protein
MERDIFAFVPIESFLPVWCCPDMSLDPPAIPNQEVFLTDSLAMETDSFDAIDSLPEAEFAEEKPILAPAVCRALADMTLSYEDENDKMECDSPQPGTEEDDEDEEEEDEEKEGEDYRPPGWRKTRSLAPKPVKQKRFRSHHSRQTRGGPILISLLKALGQGLNARVVRWDLITGEIEVNVTNLRRFFEDMNNCLPPTKQLDLCGNKVQDRIKALHRWFSGFPTSAWDRARLTEPSSVLSTTLKTANPMLPQRTREAVAAIITTVATGCGLRFWA